MRTFLIAYGLAVVVLLVVMYRHVAAWDRRNEELERRRQQ